MAYRILVVDDSPIIRRIVIRILGMLPIEVGSCLQAANGQEALDVLSEEWVDLVLSDINMPKMSGEELMRRIAESPALQDLPVVIVTSDRSKVRANQLTTLGARSVVHKPVTPESIRDALVSALGPNCLTEEEESDDECFGF